MKRLNSILQVLFAFIMLASSATSVWADEFKKGPLTFKFTPGEATCSVIKCDTLASGKVTVPKKIKCGGKTYMVTSIERRAFEKCTSMTSIKLPEGLISIEGSAFAGCTSLSSIPFPKSLTGIGYDAFGGCTSLTSITLPEGISGISNWGNSIVSITIPENATYFDGFWGFSRLDGLKEIIVDKNNTSFSSVDGMLFNKKKTELFAVPAGMTSVSIPASVKRIASGVLINFTKLEKIFVDTNNKRYTSENGMLLNKDKTELIRVPQTVTSVNIPQTVKHIGAFAFENCSSLTSIVFPDSLISIDSYIFQNCISLHSIEIPQNVVEIGESFIDDSSLAEIIVNENNTSYSSEGGVLFNKNKTKLIAIPQKQTTVTIPASVISISEEAFGDSLAEIIVDTNNVAYCSAGGVLFNKDKTMLIKAPSKLASFTVPASVKLIEKGAISSFGKHTITFKGKVPPAKAEDIFRYSGDCSIIVPAGCEEAYKKAYPKVAGKQSRNSASNILPPPTAAPRVAEIIEIIE